MSQAKFRGVQIEVLLNRTWMTTFFHGEGGCYEALSNIFIIFIF